MRTKSVPTSDTKGVIHGIVPKEPRRRMEPLPEPPSWWIKAEMEWDKKARALSERNAAQMKSGTAATLQLTMELVPKRSWYRSLAQLAPRPKWRAFRQQLFERHGGKCVICGAEAGIAHEVWEYDDASHLQHLRDIIPICKLCDRVKHFGLTGILAGQYKVLQSEVIYHFLKVNGCDLATFHRHEKEAFTIWQERRKHEWAIDYGPYAHLCGVD
jgi:hypothetical protein